MSLTATMLVCLDHLWEEFDKLDLPVEHELRKTFAAMVAAMHMDADSVSNDWLDRYPQVMFYYVFTRTRTGKYELKKRNLENGKATTSSETDSGTAPVKDCGGCQGNCPPSRSLGFI